MQNGPLQNSKCSIISVVLMFAYITLQHLKYHNTSASTIFLVTMSEIIMYKIHVLLNSFFSQKQANTFSQECPLNSFLAVLCTSEASRYLVEALESVDPSELDDVIERVLDAVEKQPCMYRAAQYTVMSP